MGVGRTRARHDTHDTRAAQPTGSPAPNLDRATERRPEPELPESGVRLVLTTFVPFDRMCDVVPAEQIRERVTTFASHAGLLYALMGSASIAGVLFDPSSAGVATAELADAVTTTHAAAAISGLESSPYTASTLLSTVMGVADTQAMHLHALDWISIFFVGSTAINLHGLLNSMLVVGRVNVLPDSKVGVCSEVSLHCTCHLLRGNSC